MELLPNELLQHIGKFLDPCDIFYLSLTCQRLRNSLIGLGLLNYITADEARIFLNSKNQTILQLLNKEPHPIDYILCIPLKKFRSMCDSIVAHHAHLYEACGASSKRLELLAIQRARVEFMKIKKQHMMCQLAHLEEASHNHLKELSRLSHPWLDPSDKHYFFGMLRSVAIRNVLSIEELIVTDEHLQMLEGALSRNCKVEFYNCIFRCGPCSFGNWAKNVRRVELIGCQISDGLIHPFMFQLSPRLEFKYRGRGMLGRREFKIPITDRDLPERVTAQLSLRDDLLKEWAARFHKESGLYSKRPPSKKFIDLQGVFTSFTLDGVLWFIKTRIEKSNFVDHFDLGLLCVDTFMLPYEYAEYTVSEEHTMRVQDTIYDTLYVYAYHNRRMTKMVTLIKACCPKMVMTGKCPCAKKEEAKWKRQELRREKMAY